MLRWFAIPLVVSGCTPWLETPDLAPGDVATISAGRYSGMAALEVRAFTGPAQIGREVCSTPVELRVDPSASPMITGSLSCTFSRGNARADLEGYDAGLPLFDGELISNDLDATFTGFFVEEDRIYMEIEGVQQAEGYRLRYLGFLDADQFAPLSGGSVGG
jgi:hypothetical protein